MKNYYQLLGLESTASKEEIKKAYREYAQNFHPDKHGGSKFFEERFKEIQEAYETLSDDTKRAKYDLKYKQHPSYSNKNQNNYTEQSTYTKQETERKEREQKEREQKKKEQEEQERKRKEQEQRKREQEEQERKKVEQEEQKNRENEKRIQEKGGNFFWILGAIIFLIFIIFAFLNIREDNKIRTKTFKISGTINDFPNESLLYLKVFSDDGELMAIDSTNLTKEGYFSFTGKSSESDLYFLADKFDIFFENVFVDIGSQITVLGSIRDILKIEGSESQTIYNKYLSSINQIKEKQNLLLDEMMELKEDNSISEKVRQKTLDEGSALYDKLEDDIKNTDIEFVKINSNSIVAAYLVYRNTNMWCSSNAIEQQYKILDSQMKNKFVTFVEKNIERVKQTEVGSVLPNIELPNKDGKPISLKSLRGKIVLVHIWISWNPTCMEDFPKLVNNYRKYRDQGFEIYSISLDPNRETWTGIVEMLESVDANWINVSDSKFIMSPVFMQYAVCYYPKYILLDTDGVIVYVNDVIPDDIFNPDGKENNQSNGKNKKFKVRNASFEMIHVEGGNFIMGCTQEQSDCFDHEKPIHNVILSDFYLGEYPVTQILWNEVMGTTIRQQRDITNTTWPIVGEGNDYPMYYINYYECEKFCEKLNNLLHTQLPEGYKFSLPTEAQWEYAARGGKKSNGYKYSGSNYIDEVAWYKGNSDNGTHKVGLKKKNELGIYDMSGNIYEWCKDFGGSYYSSNTSTNPEGPRTGTMRIARGGSHGSLAQYCRVSCRGQDEPIFRTTNYGFRISLTKTIKDSNNVTSKQLLKEDDIAGLSKQELRLMRNEIFARHGYIFNSKDLQDYFSKQSWYTPKYKDVSNKLSPIEKQNIEFIKNHE